MARKQEKGHCGAIDGKSPRNGGVSVLDGVQRGKDLVWELAGTGFQAPLIGLGSKEDLCRLRVIGGSKQKKKGKRVKSQE